MQKNHGIHHLGLATHNMEATLDFYENILGFAVRVCDILQPSAGGTIRHAFLDAGDGELIAFMECNEVPGVAADFDAGINRGLGLAGGIMHFAFAASSPEDLNLRRTALRDKGVAVSDIVDHGWCQSIYFKDPNDLQLEYCCVTQTLGSQHLADRNSQSWRELAKTGV